MEENVLQIRSNASTLSSSFHQSDPYDDRIRNVCLLSRDIADMVNVMR